MSTNVTVSVAEGRFQTLTPDQEQKLKDMWSQFLAYCNLLPESLAKSPSALTSHPQKRSWFSKKEPADTTTDFATAVDNLPPADIWNEAITMARFDSLDSLLLRFLRARKWDVNNALLMLASTLHWRIVNGKPADLLRKGEPGAIAENNDGLMLQLRKGKAWIHKNDKLGRPIVFVRPDRHDPKAQDIKAVEQFTIYLIENARLCLKDPVDTACVFFDMSRFGLGNMDYPAAKFIVQCFEGHYPECLGTLIFYKAPWVFSGIWSVIKSWLDPVVVGKIVFARNHDDLLKYLDDSVIPKEHGGSSEFEYEYVEPGTTETEPDTTTITPNNTETINEFVAATIDWIKCSDSESNLRARQRKIDLAQKLADLYWQSDKQVRAPSVYDRTGVFDYFSLLHSQWTID